ncbi:hypothetical protein EZS27_016876, partial [termite gut metagenome]
MTELYINNKLVEINNPSDLDIRLSRENYNPSTLTVKNSEYSFTFSIPSTPSNNEIFGFGNVEEVIGKFNKRYETRLYVDEIPIFEGYTYINEITETEYLCNLIVPAPKVAKDVFGEKMMNENKIWNIPFTKTSDITTYNMPKSGDITNNECIFPLIAYGLFPKTSKSVDSETYSNNDVYDRTIRIGFEDLPPAVNVLQMLKQIFKNSGYKLEGNALSERMLKELFVSYSNPSDYQMQFPVADTGYSKLKGHWENFNGTTIKPEYAAFRNDNYIGFNVLNSTNLTLSETVDNGYNIIKTIQQDASGRTCENRFYVAPVDGLYQIKLNYSNFQLCRASSGSNPLTGKTQQGTDSVGGDTPTMIYVSAVSAKGDKRANYFEKKQYEIHVVRDFGEGDFNLSNKKIIGNYFAPNLPQNSIFNTDSEDNYPKYFPQNKKLMVIDPCQDINFVCGLHFGENEKNYNAYYTHVRSSNIPSASNSMVIRNGLSYNLEFNQDKYVHSAYHNPDKYVFWTPKRPDDSSSLIINSISTNKYRNELTVSTSYNVEKGTNLRIYVEIGFSGGEGSDWIEKYDFVIPENTNTYTNDFGSQINTVRIVNVEPQADDKYIYSYGQDTSDIVQNSWNNFTDKYNVNLTNSPSNTTNVYDYSGDGNVNSIIYLEKGEKITLVSVSDTADVILTNSKSLNSAFPLYSFDFELSITPFQSSFDWIKIDGAGKGKETMNWNDTTDFKKGNINLIDFLPSKVKTSDWIDNFCKAFNLTLFQTDAKTFSLNKRNQKDIF